MKTHELKIERSKVVAQMKDLNNRAATEKRELGPDEQKQWDKMYSEFSSLEKQIQRSEFLDTQERSKAEQIIKTDEKGPATTRSKDEQAAEAKAAMAAYFKRGRLNMTQEERAALSATGLVQGMEARTQSSVTANLGAEFVREEYLNEFERHMKSFGGMMEAARIIRTNTGGNIPYPTVDDTGNVGAILGQGAADSVTDVPTDSVNIGAFKYTSKAIKVPVELIQDDGFGLVSEIPSLAAERVARISNLHMTTGDGSSKPSGFLTDATASGETIAAGSINRAAILDLIHSVDPSYRGNGKLMFNDNTLKQILKLSIGSADDRPLWLPSMRDGSPATIEGYQYVINQDMPTNAAATNKFMAFGDFSKYLIRIVQDFNIRRTDERHIEEFVVGFYGFCRMDGKLINTSAIKTLAAA